MARLCPRCAGDGKDMNGNYCRCADGKILKAMDETKEKAKAAKEAEKKKPKTAKKKEPSLESIVEKMALQYQKKELEIGDWVKHRGIVGYVGEIAGMRFMFKGIRLESSGALVDSWAWLYIDSKEYKRMPFERFDNADILLRHLAVNTNDPEWFEELCEEEQGE